MRLSILQYAGDYRAAVQNFASGGCETYYAQQYSVETVAQLTSHVDEVSVICCLTQERYDEVLENDVRAIGAGFQEDVDIQQVIQLLDKQNPTHLILRMPSPEVMKWAIRKNINTIAVFAESLIYTGWKGKIKSYLMAQLLNNKGIDWVGTYGLTSSIDVKNIGVNTNKIIPWDFLISATPGSYSPKKLRRSVESWNLLYVGSMSEEKGVGDILGAVELLRARQLPVTLKLVGQDSNGLFANRAKELGIEHCVEFLGIVPNSSVVPLMRAADVVLVPSRHEYPEGFPLTIHHALCARTPMIVSDHPMFKAHLQHHVNASVFPAGKVRGLADRVEELMKNPELYHRLSEVAYDCWHQLRLPVKWADLLERWVTDSRLDRQWLLRHSLASGIYDQVEEVRPKTSVGDRSQLYSQQYTSTYVQSRS